MKQVGFTKFSQSQWKRLFDRVQDAITQYLLNVLVEDVDIESDSRSVSLQMELEEEEGGGEGGEGEGEGEGFITSGEGELDITKNGTQSYHKQQTYNPGAVTPYDPVLPYIPGKSTN